MAISLDTSWARATNTASNSVTTGSHTPAAGTLLLALGNGNSGFEQQPVVTDLSSSPALTWTHIGTEVGSTNISGISTAYWAIATGAALTVTFATDASLNHISLHVIVVTGFDAADPIGASITGSSFTNDLTTTAYTSTVDQSQGVATGTECEQAGAITSTDTTLSSVTTGSIAGIALAKAALTTPVASSVTFNLNASGAGQAQWTYVAFEVLPAVETVATFMAPNAGIYRRGYGVVSSGMKPGTATS